LADFAKLQIEIASGVGQGVDLDGAYSNLLGKTFGAAQSIDQEEGAEPGPLRAAVNREAPEQDHRDVDSR
jgi:hypothetical protein